MLVKRGKKNSYYKGKKAKEWRLQQYTTREMNLYKAYGNFYFAKLFEAEI